MEFWVYDHSTNTPRTLDVAADPITIGRDDSCQLVLKGPFVARKIPTMDEDLQTHAVYTHLHRLVIAEVVRQSQGKVATDYRPADERLADPQREKTILEGVASIVDTMPLTYDPTAVNEDLTIAEETFDDLFNQTLPSMSQGTRAYIIRRTIAKDLQDVMFGLGPLQDLLE